MADRYRDEHAPHPPTYRELTEPEYREHMKRIDELTNRPLAAPEEERELTGLCEAIAQHEDKLYPREKPTDAERLAFRCDQMNFPFSIGDPVSKAGGDYRFNGTVVAVFLKLSGEIRIVVEDDRGVLFIASDKNYRKRDA